MDMRIKRLFLDHPATVGESYTEHLVHASVFGLQLLKAGFACLIHGVFPNLCKSTGSKIVSSPLYDGERVYDCETTPANPRLEHQPINCKATSTNTARKTV